MPRKSAEALESEGGGRPAMRHYSEEEIALYRLAPGEVSYREDLERHVRECAECAARVAADEELDIDLSDPEVWPENPASPESRSFAPASLIAAASTGPDEDAAAE